MPIVNPTSTAAPVQAPNTPRIAAPAYKGVTVDTRYVPSASILKHIEGSSWTVHYYSQILDGDSALAGQNVTLDPLYQQYRLIKGLELKVNSPLTQSQDTEGGSMVVSGAATVYPFLIPNVGDMFLADTGDGREGVFQVTLSERKTIYKDACFGIEYRLVAYSTPERLNDLAAKTIDTLRYVRDFLNHGQNPLLYEEEFLLATELSDAYHSIAGVYFRQFMSREFMTILVPGQQVSVYDHFLTQAVTSFFTTWDAPELRQIRKLNISGDEVMRAPTIWDALRARDKSLVMYSAKKAGLVSTRTFDRDPMLEGIYHSGIQYTVYPKDAEVSIDYALLPRTKVLADLVLEDPASPYINEPVPPAGDLPYGAAPLYKMVGVDDYYVFSQAFYENAAEGQSKLERAVWDYLDGKAIDSKLLLALCKSYFTWPALERFYFVPVILMLIKASIRGI